MQHAPTSSSLSIPALRSEVSGQVIAPELRFLSNSYVERGKELFTVATTDKLLCRAVLTQRDVALASRLMNRADGTLQLPTPPRVRLISDVQTPLNGGVTKLIPSAVNKLPGKQVTQAGGGEIAVDPKDQSGEHAETNEFELRVEVNNPHDLYTAGQRAYVRLLVDKRPLVWQWYDRFLQLIETRNVQSKWL